MPESNLPSGTADGGALSFDDGVSAIENLDIGSDKPNPENQVEATNEAEAEETPEEGVETEEAETDEQDGAEEEDGPDEVGKGGKFVSNDAKVTLNDGTVTTVEALKRGFMSQQSFTRSTQEVAAEKKALAEHKAQFGQVAQSLVKQRDFILQAAQKFLPTPPDREMMQSDPFGYMQAKADYDERMQVINQLQYQQHSETGRMTEEQKREADERKATEAAKLMEAVPEFRDRKVYDQFWNDAAVTMAEHYGFTAEELAETTDHRMYLAMRDLVKYRKALKQAPKVAQDIKAKPKLMQGGRRMDPKAKTSREAQQRSENLRKTGDFDAGVRALMDLDL
jgi:hypothetical protein